jgi:hypothetical protein
MSAAQVRGPAPSNLSNVSLSTDAINDQGPIDFCITTIMGIGLLLAVFGLIAFTNKLPPEQIASVMMAGSIFTILGIVFVEYKTAKNTESNIKWKQVVLDILKVMPFLIAAIVGLQGHSGPVIGTISLGPFLGIFAFGMFCPGATKIIERFWRKLQTSPSRFGPEIASARSLKEYFKTYRADQMTLLEVNLERTFAFLNYAKVFKNILSTDPEFMAAVPSYKTSEPLNKIIRSYEESPLFKAVIDQFLRKHDECLRLLFDYSIDLYHTNRVLTDRA